MVVGGTASLSAPSPEGQNWLRGYTVLGSVNVPGIRNNFPNDLSFSFLLPFIISQNKFEMRVDVFPIKR